MTFSSLSCCPNRISWEGQSLFSLINQRATMTMRMTLRLVVLFGLLSSLVVLAHIDHPKFRRALQKVEYEYIIIFQDNVPDPHALAQSLVPEGAVINFYEKIVHGFSVRLPESALGPILDHDGVKSVEEVSLSVKSDVVALNHQAHSFPFAFRFHKRTRSWTLTRYSHWRSGIWTA